MASNTLQVLGIVKARLNRLASDKTLDDYLTQRIDAADKELAADGINLAANAIDDAVFLADVVAWQHNNRDQNAGMPDWLRLRRRERWLKEREK